MSGAMFHMHASAAALESLFCNTDHARVVVIGRGASRQANVNSATTAEGKVRDKYNVMPALVVA